MVNLKQGGEFMAALLIVEEAVSMSTGTTLFFRISWSTASPVILGSMISKTNKNISKFNKQKKAENKKNRSKKARRLKMLRPVRWKHPTSPVHAYPAYQ